MEPPLNDCVDGDGRLPCTDFAVSNSGTELYILRAKSSVPNAGTFDLERWDIGSMCHASFSKRTILEIGEDDIYWQSAKVQDHASFTLVPSRSRLLIWKPCAFLAAGAYIRLGSKALKNPLRDPNADEQLSEPPTGYWEEVSYGNGVIATSRRKRPRQKLNAKDDEARISRLKSAIDEREVAWGRRVRRRSTTNAISKQDELVDFEASSDDPLSFVGAENDSVVSIELSDKASVPSGSLDSGSIAYSSENESDSDLSDTEESSDAEGTKSEDDLDSYSSLTSSAASVSSIDGIDRMRAHEFFSASNNDLHFQEVVRQSQNKICDACQEVTYRWLHCFVCSDADFDICVNCADDGQWCFDRSHRMLEADGNGAIIVRRHSTWLFKHELRIFEGDSEIFNFTAKNEGLLHESPPALHSMLPIVAWPISSNKFLLAHFRSGDERIIQKLKPFSPSGRRISVSTKFSEGGLFLFVGSVEAQKTDTRATRYRLSMQVAILQIRLDAGKLQRATPLREQHCDLGVVDSTTLENLPYSWTWTSTYVYLAVASEDLKIYSVRLPEPSSSQPTLGTVTILSPSRRPANIKDMLKCEYVPGSSSSAGEPDSILLLGCSSGNISPLTSLHRIKVGSSEWRSANPGRGDVQNPMRDSEKQKKLKQNQQATKEITSRLHQIPEGHSLPSLNQFRSEIRLLYLLSGKDDEEVHCQLTTVSLDDLESVGARQSIWMTDLDERNEEKRRKQRKDSPRPPPDPFSEPEKSDDPNFVPEVLGEIDYSNPENANVSYQDFMSKTFLASADKIQKMEKLVQKNLDRNSTALAATILNEKKSAMQTFHFSKYNYAALSYVWGSWSEQRTITIDGRSGIPISNNLFAALKRLRRKDGQRTLWIDSLCIDQTNVDERNWQVQLMGRIYSSAQFVLVWLGNASNPRPPAFEDVKLWPVFDAVPLDGQSREMTEEAKQLLEWTKSVLQETIDTASPPWWTRAWIPQELVLARDIRVAFGEVEMPWFVFRQKLWKIWDPIGSLRRLISLRENRWNWQYQGSIGETALLVRYCDATDVRDKVYSLLSLIKPLASAMMKANYALEPSEVFMQATYIDLWVNVTDTETYQESPASHSEGASHADGPKYPVFSIHNDGNVQTGLRPDRYRILNWAKPTPNRLPDLPTWAVDFSDKSAFTEDAEFRYGKERWTFDGNRNLHEHARLRISKDHRKLLVRGLIFDFVDSALTCFPVRDYRHHTEEVEAELAEAFSRLSQENPFVSATGPALLRTDDARKLVRPNWKITQMKPGTIAVGFDRQVTEVLPHWNPAQTGAVDWSKMNDVGFVDCEMPGCRCGPSRLFRKWDECVGLPPDARNFIIPDRTRTSPWDDYCGHLKENKLMHKQKSDPLKEEDIAFLITSTHGFVGLARDRVRPGDVIALFYGSDIPVILRPRDGHYIYEGRAWINGIMMGELWNIYQDPMLEEKDFEIW